MSDSIRPVRGKKRRGIRRLLTPYAYLTPTAILMMVLMSVPIIMVVSYSLMDNVIMNRNPEFVGLANYREVFGDKVFWEATRNTLHFTVGSVIAHMVLGLAFATMLNTDRLSVATRSIFRVIYILPWVFTAAIIAILWRLLLNPNGIVNYFIQALRISSERIEWLSSRRFALPALTYINIWAGYPFYMVSLLAGLQGISADLYEAATVDGANGPKRFLHITLPQLRPIILSMAMLDFIWTMQQFALVWMTTGGGPVRATEMLSTYTYKLAFSKYAFSLASTSAVIILVFSILLATIYVRTQKARD